MMIVVVLLHLFGHTLQCARRSRLRLGGAREDQVPHDRVHLNHTGDDDDRGRTVDTLWSYPPLCSEPCFGPCVRKLGRRLADKQAQPRLGDNDNDNTH